MGGGVSSEQQQAGGGVEAPVVAATVKHYVVVWGAKDLRDTDFVGTSDAYCIARAGKVGTTWEEKPSSSSRRSEVIASTSPEWNFAMVYFLPEAEASNYELTVRVYDKDTFTEDDSLGACTFRLGEEKEKVWVPLEGEDRSMVQVTVTKNGPVQGVKTSALFGELTPTSGYFPVVNWDVNQGGECPMPPGRAPLPKALRGVFWLTNQGASSVLASFWGPNGDGGGCNTGQMIQNQLRLRVSGDRSWAFSTNPETGGNLNNAELIDLVYTFHFDSAENPTKSVIYPSARNLGLELTAEWITRFEMNLVEGGLPDYPGSIVWQRESSVFGSWDEGETAGRYKLIQVVDEDGKRIEQAWKGFTEFLNSSMAGDSNGHIFFHDSQATAAAATEAAE